MRKCRDEMHWGSGFILRARRVREARVINPAGGIAREEAALSEHDATIVGRVETKPEGHFMDMQFIASIAVIASDPSVSRRFYVDALA